MLSPIVKTCRKCKDEKPTTEFNKDRCSSDGLSYICKPCAREKDRLRYAANPEKERARQKAMRDGTALKPEMPTWPPGFKGCIACQEIKPYSEFFVKKSAADGYFGRCKACDQKKALRWKRANPERSREHVKACIERDPERHRALSSASAKRRYWKDPEKVRSQMLVRQKNNPELARENARIRRERERQATPPWITAEHLNEIRRIKMLAVFETMDHGIKYTADHIFPLKGKNFSGLNVPWNFQIITSAENSVKSNSFPPELIHLGWE